MQRAKQAQSARPDSDQLRIRLGLLILALVTASMAVVLFLAQNGPEFGGRNVAQWLMRLDANADKRKEHDEAAAALGQIGQSAVPELRRILRRRSGSIPEFLRQGATRLRLLRPEPLPLYEQQSRAARAAYILAESANVDIAALVPYLRSQLIQSRYAEAECARALMNAGPNGVDVLKNLLATGSSHVRDQAGWALGMATSKPGVVETLVRAANMETDRVLRANCLLYLSHAKGHDPVLVDLGLRFLQSEDAYDRRAGVFLLAGHMDEDGVRPTLEKATNDPDEQVRSEAMGALRR